MARMAFKAGDEYALKLSKLAENSKQVAEKAIKAAADIVADEIRRNLSGVLSTEATGELMDSFGITPVLEDKSGDWNAKIGFDGYDKRKSKKYPKGIPNQLKARALESGTYKQRKTPYIAPAVRSTKKRAKQVMETVIEQEHLRLME